MSEHDEAVARVRVESHDLRIMTPEALELYRRDVLALLAAYDALSERHEAVCSGVDAELKRVVDEQFGPVLAERAAMHQALRNVRALAARMMRAKGEGAAKRREEAGHLLRFCKEAGVEASILRESADD